MPVPFNAPVGISSATAAPTATITRPADTTTYAAGDEVNSSTSAPAVLTFSGCALRLGGSGAIVGAQMVSSAVPALIGQFELWLFNATNTPQNDNAAFGPSDAEALTVVAIIPFSYSYDTANNRVYTSGDIARPFICAAADTKLYGRVCVRNAYVPANAETLAITLQLLQDA